MMAVQGRRAQVASAVVESRDGGCNHDSSDQGRGRQGNFQESQLSLREVEERLQNLAKPPAPKDLAHFRDVCNLKSGIAATNPHRLKIGKQITNAMMTAMFGEGRGRSGFNYLECKNVEARRLLGRLWPLCYSKPTLPANKLISREFCLGILAEHQLGWDIDWAFLSRLNHALSL